MIRRLVLAFWVVVAVPAAGGPYSEELRAPLDPAECAADPDSWSIAALARLQEPTLGLPPMAHPAESTPSREKIELGRKLFFDRRLSINNTMSCAMCHVPEQAFANWELATSVGVEGRSVKRNAPSLLNIGSLSVLFHDGRDGLLETQFVGPLVARNEMSNPSVGRVVALLNDLPEYREMFAAAFGAPASLDRIGQALGIYQRSLVAGDTPFDRWHFGGEAEAVPETVKRGFALFSGKGGCTSCHLVEDEFALFTDESFHDTGYGQMRETARQNPPASVPVRVAPGVVHQLDFARVQSVSARREADLGRYEVTEDPADRWHFRTPSLRNVGATPPYMHDGHLTTLAQVIEFYDQGGAGVPGQDPRIRPLGLNDEEKHALEAFLNSLTAENLTCLAGEARVHPPDNY